MFRPTKMIINNLLSWEHVEFDFHIGKPVVVVGDNQDDPGQKGNGSGKSGLTEGAVIAITGSVVRPQVTSKEIVRRGCDFGDVTLYLENTMYDCRLKIYRKLYSGSKSAEYRCWENDIDQYENYADSNQFNAYIFTMLGISKEDFYDFYVLEKTTKPFLLRGDAEKKAVVNRFSGAYKVDNAIPNVEKDVTIKNEAIKNIDSLITSIKGKQELLSDQINEEQEKNSQEAIDKLIKEHKEVIKDYESDLEDNQIPINDLKEQIAEKQKEIKAFVKTDFVKKKAANAKGLAGVEKRIQTAEAEIKEIKTRKNEAIGIKDELTNLLAGSIACPKCDHIFSLEDENFDAKVSTDELKEIKEEIIPDIDKELIVANDQLKKAEEDKTKLRQDNQSLQKKEDEEIRNLRALNQSLTKLEDDLLKEVKANKSLEDKIQKEKDAIEELKNGNSEKVEKLSEQLAKYIDEETELQDKLQKAITDKATIEVWITHFKNFKSHLANKSIANIQDYTNLYLQEMGSNIQILLEGYKVLSNKKVAEKITAIVRRNGLDDASYGTYSGGEKGRIDICTIIAIQTLINLNSTTGGLDLLILDEVMDSVDSLGLENIIRALQNIDRTIMIVTQNEINSLKEYTLTIRKQNRKSIIA